jgi:hypothetical protein
MNAQHARMSIRYLALAGWPAQHFGPVVGQPLHVLRVSGVGERVIQHRIFKASFVMSRRQPQKRGPAPGELVDRWARHRTTFSYSLTARGDPVAGGGIRRWAHREAGPVRWRR